MPGDLEGGGGPRGHRHPRPRGGLSSILQDPRALLRPLGGKLGPPCRGEILPQHGRPHEAGRAGGQGLSLGPPGGGGVKKGAEDWCPSLPSGRGSPERVTQITARLCCDPGRRGAKNLIQSARGNRSRETPNPANPLPGAALRRLYLAWGSVRSPLLRARYAPAMRPLRALWQPDPPPPYRACCGEGWGSKFSRGRYFGLRPPYPHDRVCCGGGGGCEKCPGGIFG